MSELSKRTDVTVVVSAAVAGAALGAATAWFLWERSAVKDASVSRPSSSPGAEGSSAADAEEFDASAFRSVKPLAPGRPLLKNDLLVRTARGEVGERVPVWAMRQAGRYLPEFRKARKELSFFDMCSTPSAAADVTLQPLRRFRGLLDAVVIFSDILIVPQAMGMHCEMQPAKGPTFPTPLRDPAQLASLVLHPDTSEIGPFGCLYEAIRETRRLMEDQVPVVGFCGGPWTLLAYMVDGSGSKTFEHSKAWLFKVRLVRGCSK
jgi:hypothetical protein